MPPSLPRPTVRLTQTLVTREHENPQQTLKAAEILSSPEVILRVHYGHSLSVPLLLIKSPNSVIVKLCACWLPWGKKPPTTHSCSVTGDEGQLPSKIDGLALSCW